MELYLYPFFIFFMLAVFICLLVIYHNTVKEKAPSSVHSMAVKLQSLNHHLLPYGFQYAVKGDYLYALPDCPQRNSGYCQLYRELAPDSNIIIDSESIYFEYNNKCFLLELGKGQYGICAGAEAGLYYTKLSKTSPTSFEEVHFDSVSDKDCISIDLTVYFHNRVILHRKGTSFWLTAFRPGIFCEPEHLRLQVSLSFPNLAMRKAYVEGLLKAGYKPSEITSHYVTTTISFKTPKILPPLSRSSLTSKFILYNNYICCQEYQHLMEEYDAPLDKLTYLYISAPALFAALLSSIKTVKYFEQSSNSIQDNKTKGCVL